MVGRICHVAAIAPLAFDNWAAEALSGSALTRMWLSEGIYIPPYPCGGWLDTREEYSLAVRRSRLWLAVTYREGNVRDAVQY